MDEEFRRYAEYLGFGAQPLSPSMTAAIDDLRGNGAPESERVNMNKIAEFIPAAYRKIVYTVLAAAVALEAIWDVVPEPIEGKVLASLVALGFGLAFTQTKD